MFSALLGAILPSLLGGLANKATNKLMGTDSKSHQSPATPLLTDLYNQIKGTQLPQYSYDPITGEQVEYTGVGAPGQINPQQVTPGQLNLQGLGDINQVTQNGYNASSYNPSAYNAQQAGVAAQQAALLGQAQGYGAENVTGQQIKDIAGYDASTIDPAQLAELATYNPQAFEAAMMGDPSLVQDNAAMKAQLEGNLSTLSERAKTGFDSTDQMENNMLLSEGARQSTREQNAIQDNMRQRGVAGGGQESIMRMLASQGAGQSAQAGSLNLAKQARDRKDSALGQATNLAGNLRNTDIALSGQNAGIKNTADQFNTTTKNNAGIFNSGQQTAANKSAADNKNTQMQVNAQMAQQAAMANQGAANQAGQFNANATNSVNSQNAGLAQQAGMANQNANNQAAQNNANANNQFSMANQGAQNQANSNNANAFNQNSQFNAGAQNQAGQFNSGAQNQAGQFNAGAQNSASQFGAAANNAGNMFNAQAANTRQGENANVANQGAIANFNALNQANQFNAGQSLASQQANIANSMNANQFNATQGNNMSRDNTNINNSMQINNQNQRFNVQQQQVADMLAKFGIQGNAAGGLATQYNAEQAAQAQRQYAAQNSPMGQALGGLANQAAGGITSWLGNLFGGRFEEGGYAEPGKFHVVGDDAGNPDAKPELIMGLPGGGTQVIPNNAETEAMINMFMRSAEDRDDKSGEKNYNFPPKYNF